MRLQGLSKWSVAAVAAVLVLLAGVGLYCVKSRQPLDASPVRPESLSPRIDTGPEGGTVVAQLSDVPAREVVETNGAEAIHHRAHAEGMAAETTFETAHVSSTAKPLAVGYSIRGAVVSKDGPVRDDEPGQWLSVTINAPGFARRCEIDEQGCFECSRLGAGSYVVSVGDRMMPHRLMCRPVEVHLDAQTPSREVTFVLGEEVPVAAVVLYEDSLEPVSGCRVDVRLTDGPGSAEAQTDPQGCCVLRLIPGRYRIRANRDESMARVIVVPPSARGLAVDFRVSGPKVPKERMIRGILVDSRGNRIKGYVDLGPAVHEPNSEPADSFSIPEPGYTPPDGLIGYAYSPSGEFARRFTWQQDASEDDLVIVLEPRARIVGRLVGADGKPVSDAQVALQTALADGYWRDGDESLYTLTMGGAGGFGLEGLAVGLKVRIVAYRAELRLQGRSGTLELKPGQTCDASEIVLRPPEKLTGIVRGRIIDENGEPVVDGGIEISAKPVAGHGTDDERYLNAFSGNPGTGRGTDPNGYFTVQGLLPGQPVTVAVRVPRYRGEWSQTTTAGDLDCNFQVYPSGWGVVGEDAPPLVVDRWFNHPPMTLEELRGRVVLLAFGAWAADRSGIDAWSTIRNLAREYGSKGLVIIVFFGHLPADHPVAENATRYHLDAFGGLPIAGCFDADPNSITDPMPKDRPLAASSGVTHWRYRVSTQPAFFLIDKQGTVRDCVERRDLWDRVASLLAE